MTSARPPAENRGKPPRAPALRAAGLGAGPAAQESAHPRVVRTAASTAASTAAVGDYISIAITATDQDGQSTTYAATLVGPVTG